VILNLTCYESIAKYVSDHINKINYCLIFNRNTGYECSNYWLDLLGDDDLNSAMSTSNQLQKCLPRCAMQSTTATFSSTAFPTKSSFSQDSDFCLALSKVARICNQTVRARMFESAPEHTGVTCNNIMNAKLCTENGEPNSEMIRNNNLISNVIYNYAKTNFLFLTVFIKEPYFTLIKRDEQMSLISFLGNTGGLLGLCLGLSLVSIFEMFYHLIRFCNENVKRHLFQN
jgi:hypothetical protein